MQLQYSFPSQASRPALEYVVGRRFVALLIDVIILGIFQFLIFIGISAMGLHSSGKTTTTQGDAYDKFVYWLTHLDPYAVLQIVVITIIPIVYFTIMEAVQGATVGKMVLGIRVVKLDGSDISRGQAIVRNLLRIVDQLPPAIPYLLGSVLILNSSKRQRLGDRWAGTVVVRRSSSTPLHIDKKVFVGTMGMIVAVAFWISLEIGLFALGGVIVLSIISGLSWLLTRRKKRVSRL